MLQQHIFSALSVIDSLTKYHPGIVTEELMRGWKDSYGDTLMGLIDDLWKEVWAAERRRMGPKL